MNARLPFFFLRCVLSRVPFIPTPPHTSPGWLTRRDTYAEKRAEKSDCQPSQERTAIRATVRDSPRNFGKIDPNCSTRISTCHITQKCESLDGRKGWCYTLATASNMFFVQSIGSKGFPAFLREKELANLGPLGSFGCTLDPALLPRQAVSACRNADGGVILERTPSQAPAPAEREEEEKGTKEKEDGMKTPLPPRQNLPPPPSFP